MTSAHGVSVCDRFGSGSRLHLHDEAAVFAPADIIAPAGTSLVPGRRADHPGSAHCLPRLRQPGGATGSRCSGADHGDDDRRPGRLHGRQLRHSRLWPHGVPGASVPARATGGEPHPRFVRAVERPGRADRPRHHHRRPAAIRARVTACREQGIALALIDAVDAAPQAAIREALAPSRSSAAPPGCCPKRRPARTRLPPGGAKMPSSPARWTARRSSSSAPRARRAAPATRPLNPRALPAALAWAAEQTEEPHHFRLRPRRTSSPKTPRRRPSRGHRRAPCCRRLTPFRAQRQRHRQRRPGATRRHHAQRRRARRRPALASCKWLQFFTKTRRVWRPRSLPGRI